ncbi:MAG: hypothetical protein DIU78_021005 [Pseudomonadota bacterium]
MSRERNLPGLDGSDPLGFLAAIGLLRIVSRFDTEAQLRFVRSGNWIAAITTTNPDAIEDLVLEDLARLRKEHPAIDFARNTEDRKVQDLKPPPADFRALMRSVMDDEEGAAFFAAYATGVAVDGSGQTKPTSFHLTAGQQRFMDAVLDILEHVTRDDLVEALNGPWIGREGVKNLRFRAASERLRALLSFDPSKEPARTEVGAYWLAFQGLPCFPCVPVGFRVRTTGIRGSGKNESFTWPIWTVPLTYSPARAVVGLRNLARLSAHDRARHGIGEIFTAKIDRNSQGYGNFAAADPV